MSKQLIIYTDGASRGNPGRGGWGAILMWGGARKELSAGYRKTTNNRMELMAVIEALRALTKPGLDVTIFTDSKYIVDSVQKGWLQGWMKKGFTGKKNEDLWRQYVKAAAIHNVKFTWVRGHSDNPFNNRCDELATMVADSGPWLVDEVYEQVELFRAP